MTAASASLNGPSRFTKKSFMGSTALAHGRILVAGRVADRLHRRLTVQTSSVLAGLRWLSGDVSGAPLPRVRQHRQHRGRGATRRGRNSGSHMPSNMPGVCLEPDADLLPSVALRPPPAPRASQAPVGEGVREIPPSGGVGSRAHGHARTLRAVRVAAETRASARPRSTGSHNGCSYPGGGCTL